MYLPIELSSQSRIPEISFPDKKERLDVNNILSLKNVMQIRSQHAVWTEYV